MQCRCRTGEYFYQISTTDREREGQSRTMNSPAPELVLEERQIVSTKKEPTKRKTTSTAVDDLTSEEREAVTIVFHQFETGLREGTIFTKVKQDKEGDDAYKTNLDHFSSIYSVFKLSLIGWGGNEPVLVCPKFP